jgi:hypothetical protein
MDDSYLLQMNLRSGHGSTSARAAHGLSEGQGESGRANEHGNGEGQEAPLLAPHPFPPPPPPMTHAEMMAELMAAHCESARDMDLLSQAVAGFARGGHGGNGRNRGGAYHPKGPSSY